MAAIPGAPAEPPKPGAPPLPPKPGAPPASPNVKAITGFSNDKAEQGRIRSNMLVLDGGGGAAKGGPDMTTAAANNALNDSDPNKAFTANALKASEAEKTTATRLNKLSVTIAQGKIITAILETAIDTELPGTLRAIIARDVYAEAGRNVMIPKGSRLIGTYNTGIARGQVRVLIVWTRLIRPDGVDVQIGSGGIDKLGRAGVMGDVDNKYSEIFSTALLTSVLSIVVAEGADKLSSQPTTTTSSPNGSTTTGSAGSAAAVTALNNIGNISQSIVNSMIDIHPVITVDQGTEVDVFVNRDVTFPGNPGEMTILE
jgi:type IV secretion system protein VirB10